MESKLISHSSADAAVGAVETTLLQSNLLLLLQLFEPLYKQWKKQVQRQKQQQHHQQQHLCLNEKLFLIRFNLISTHLFCWYAFEYYFCTSM